MSKSKLKAILISSLMVIGSFQPVTVSAQLDGQKGLFGKGEDKNLVLFDENKTGNTMILGIEGLVDYYDYDGGLFNKGKISTGGLSNQGFGEIPTGITNESFQQDAPLGNGLLFMLVSGVGYAVTKKKSNKKSKTINNHLS